MLNSNFKEDLDPKNIIVRMPNWLGDLVMATPVLKDLRDRWPEAKITAMCQNGVGNILVGNPYIDEILNFKRPNGWIHRIFHGGVVEPLKQGHYDLGILLTNSFSSAWFFWRGQVKNRVGYATHQRSLLLNYPVPFPENKEKQHLVITYKMLLTPLGIPLSDTSPELFITSEEKKEIQDSLVHFGVTKDSITVGINPGAAYGSAKCWLPERFKEVAKKLTEDPRVVVLFVGDKSGAPMINEICDGLSERVINLAGKTTLRELIGFIQASQVFLTNDSGPMHIASALGVPLVALFGSTSDITTGPYKGGIVIHKRAACSPCYRRECPIDFRCMTEISVGEVVQAIRKLMK